MGAAAIWIIRICAAVVPADHRSGWRRQWLADLHHQREWHAASGRSGREANRDLIRRALGAARHALWLRARSWRSRMGLEDIRYAFRRLRHRPGFSLVVILTLGLAIGANATIFSWVDALAFHALPGVVDESSLVAIHPTTATRRDLSLSYPTYRDIRDHLPAGLVGVLASRNLALAVRIGDGDPERTWAEIVTGNYFDVFGVRPALGRLIEPSDDAAEMASPVVVVSDHFWRTRFGSRPDIVGTSIGINGRAFTIVGVSPAGFKGGLNGLAVDAWVPMSMQQAVIAGARLAARGNGWLFAIARLAPGASWSSVQAGLSGLAAELSKANTADAGRGLGMFPLRTEGAGQTLLPVVSVVMGVVAAVLFVACANIAGLMAARASADRRELAIRLAIGASRAQVVRQLVVESLLLAALGGLAGLLLAAVSTGLLSALLPAMPFNISIPSEVNRNVLGIAAVAVALATVIFGAGPAWMATRPQVLPALRDGVGATMGRGRARWRATLVATQVAMALVLLVCAGLFVRAMAASRRIDPGFAERRAILTTTDLSSAGYDAAHGRQFYRDLVARLEREPGIRSATMTTQPPLSMTGGSDTSPTIEGYTPAPHEEIVVFYSSVGVHYFETLRQRVIAGRPLDARDTNDAPLAVVINETMAKRYFRNRQAVGGRLDYGSGWATVVGVAENARYGSLADPPKSVMYMAMDQVYRPAPTLIVATTGDPAAMTPAIRRVVASFNPNLPLFEVRTLESHVDAAVFLPKLAAGLLAGFGVLAALLAVMGLYGVVAFHVATRTREIGVRMALGAARKTIASDVLRRGLKLTTIGLAVGLPLAAVVTPLLRSQLLGVQPYDPVVLAGTVAALLAVSVAASWIPARRAARVDPIAALRQG
jgi:predicted permease